MEPVTRSSVHPGSLIPSEHHIHEFLIVARKVATAAALILISTSSYPFLAAATLFSAVLLDCALHIDIEKKPDHVTIAALEKRNAQLNATLDETLDRVTALQKELNERPSPEDADFNFTKFFNSFTLG